MFLKLQEPAHVPYFYDEDDYCAAVQDAKQPDMEYTINGGVD